MTSSTPDGTNLEKTSGISISQLLELLNGAEPIRLTALNVTVNLMAVMTVWSLMLSPLSVQMLFAGPFSLMFGLPWLMLALAVPTMLWMLSTMLWRVRVLGKIAPLIGEKWGMSYFASGVKAMEWGDFFDDGFPPKHGMHYTRWRSSGRYRETHFRSRETSHRYKKRPVRHWLFVEVSVGGGFGGPIEITSRGLVGQLTFFMRAFGDGGVQTKTNDPDFDAAFDVFCPRTTSLDAALTPDIRKAFLSILNQMPKGNFAAKIENGWLYIELELEAPLLARANLLRPLSEHVYDAERLWWELTVPHRLIDSLKGDHDGRLY